MPRYQIEPEMIGPDFTGTMRDLLDNDFRAYLSAETGLPEDSYVYRQHVTQEPGAPEPTEDQWDNAVHHFATDHPGLFR